MRATGTPNAATITAAATTAVSDSRMARMQPGERDHRRDEPDDGQRAPGAGPSGAGGDRPRRGQRAGAAWRRGAEGSGDPLQEDDRGGCRA